MRDGRRRDRRRCSGRGAVEQRCSASVELAGGAVWSEELVLSSVVWSRRAGAVVGAGASSCAVVDGWCDELVLWSVDELVLSGRCCRRAGARSVTSWCCRRWTSWCSRRAGAVDELVLSSVVLVGRAGAVGGGAGRRAGALVGGLVRLTSSCRSRNSSELDGGGPAKLDRCTCRCSRSPGPAGVQLCPSKCPPS